MENLTDAGKKSSARSGLQKLKRIRDEMFKKRHQSLKEEDENKQNQENSPAGILFGHFERAKKYFIHIFT